MTEFLDFFGIAVFAISGALVAGRVGFDVFGVLVIALLTALGGGTLRDLILDAHPVAWIENTHYLTVGIVAGLSTFGWVRLRRIPFRVLEVCDAVGLAFFTVAGAQKALSLGHEPEICVLMGMMTGVAGGVLRDVVCNELPLIFHKEIYATAAIVGAISFLLAESWLTLGTDIAILIGMLVTLSLRLSGIFFGWSLPVFLKQEGRQRSE